MILILSISERSRGAWLLSRKGKLTKEEFTLEPGSDKLLFFLGKFLKKEKTELKKIKGVIFLLREASLTQIKICTTIINTIAWYFNIPAKARFYFKGDLDKVLSQSLAGFPKNKKFVSIKAKYSQKVDITLSKKQIKYKISP